MDEHLADPLQAPSFPTAGHCPCGLALLSVSAQPAPSIAGSYETIRRWAKKFGPDYARRLRRKQPSPGDVWHLDEVAITIAGKKHWWWRTLDQGGYEEFDR